MKKQGRDLTDGPQSYLVGGLVFPMEPMAQKVVAIENYISDNNLYRVLLVPDAEDHPWPSEVRIGSGARTIALLNEVSVWYELWRQLNGFPPDYYKVETAGKVKLPINIK